MSRTLPRARGALAMRPLLPLLLLVLAACGSPAAQATPMQRVSPPPVGAPGVTAAPAAPSGPTPAFAASVRSMGRALLAIGHGRRDPAFECPLAVRDAERGLRVSEAGPGADPPEVVSYDVRMVIGASARIDACVEGGVLMQPAMAEPAAWAGVEVHVRVMTDGRILVGGIETVVEDDLVADAGPLPDGVVELARWLWKELDADTCELPMAKPAAVGAACGRPRVTTGPIDVRMVSLGAVVAPGSGDEREVRARLHRTAQGLCLGEVY
jgi:hypothetical protein